MDMSEGGPVGLPESDRFYLDIPPFSDFGGITDDIHFYIVPDDWVVVITDVRGSTQAVEAGRYKDVNTIGAAAIASVQNALGGREFPYVFGGDGATLLVSAADAEDVRRSLGGLKALAQQRFGLELRVGMVPVERISDRSKTIRVAKFQLVGKKCVAFFRGGGLAEAETMVKSSLDYEISELQASASDLKGLSCRWKPLPSKKGRILSLLVVARSSQPEGTYREIIQWLNEAFDGQLEQGNPVNLPEAGYRSMFQCLRDEVRLHETRFSLSLILRLMKTVLAVCVIRLRVPLGSFDPSRYLDSIPAHSDYRKFDDALRMVLDCTPAQVTSIRSYLESLRLRGDIHYGLHESDDSLMTCYVPSVAEGSHIHFIDGGNGGYAMAAKELKSQMRGL